MTEAILQRTREFRGGSGVTLRGSEFWSPDQAAEGTTEAPHAPVLLLHGGGQTRGSWSKTARRLAERGHRVVALDLRGHGESEWAEGGGYGIEKFAEDIYEVARADDARPVLVGASLGGLAALVAEATYTFAEALVLVDVAPRLEPRGVERIVAFMTARPDGFASMEEAAEAISDYQPHRERPKEPSGLGKNLRRRADGRYVWHWDPRFLEGRPAGSARMLEEAAARVHIPVLLVRGMASDLLSEEGASEFLKLVPHAEVARVLGARHMVVGDKNDAFADAVLAFLARLPAGGRPKG